MMSPETPGQRAYEAYSATLPVRAGWTSAAWARLAVGVQAAWEAAALAVRAQEDRRVQHQADVLTLVSEARPFFEDAFAGVLECIELRPHGRGLRVVALVTSDDLSHLTRCLRAFDEAWWRANCHRSHGLIVFDYETLPHLT